MIDFPVGVKLSSKEITASLSATFLLYPIGENAAAIYEVQPQHLPRPDIPESQHWGREYGRQVAHRKGRTWYEPGGWEAIVERKTLWLLNAVPLAWLPEAILAMEIEPCEEDARNFAAAAHAGVARKYTGEPYITHPAAVAALVRSVPHTPAQLQACWLHDVDEDTPVTLMEIRRHFGAEVADLVEMVTDVSRPEDGSREKRKAIDLAHTARATSQGQTIKLADGIDNIPSIVEHDAKFASIYVPEKVRLAEVLREGDATLLAMMVNMLSQYHQGHPDRKTVSP